MLKLLFILPWLLIGSAAFTVPGKIEYKSGWSGYQYSNSCSTGSAIKRKFASGVYFLFSDPKHAVFSIHSNEDPFNVQDKVKISIEVGDENYRLHPAYNKAKTEKEIVFRSMEGFKIAKALEQGYTLTLKITGRMPIGLRLENTNMVLPEMLDCFLKNKKAVVKQANFITFSGGNNGYMDKSSDASMPAILRVPLERVTSFDRYPTRAVREGRGGTVAFGLSVLETGRASNCSIIRSSGHDDIDRAACKSMMRYSRFLPATNRMGRPAKSAYQGELSFSGELAKSRIRTRGDSTWCPQPVITIN